MISVTGMGVASAAATTSKFLQSVFEQKSLHHAIELEEHQSLAFKEAAFAILTEEQRKALPIAPSRLDAFAVYALVAAEEAVKQARLSERDIEPHRISVIIGTANGGIDTIQTELEKLAIRKRRPHPLTIPKVMGNSAASIVSSQFSAKGPVMGITSACASGAQAIGMGFELLMSGVADIAIVGGADACATYSYLKAWESLGVVSKDTCRPFDQQRNGLTIGDGAGILVLERSDKFSCSPPALANMVGYGMSADAGNLTAPDQDGMAIAMKMAIDRSGISASQVGYVNAHGTGTKLNDLCEAKAIRSIFNSSPNQPYISATKPIHGHTMGATGAMEAIISIEALRRREIPGTFGLEHIDPDCSGINILTNTTPSDSLTHILTNSFAFGGINCSLVFSIHS